MAHEKTNIDLIGVRDKQAWHGLADVFTENLTALQAYERYLAWEVDPWKLAALGPAALSAFALLGTALKEGNLDQARHYLGVLEANRIEVESHHANVRVDVSDSGDETKHLLGVVGASYKIAQNRELAEFTDALAQTGEIVIETVGSIRGGKRVWFEARGEAFDIGGVDKVYPYLLVSNGHDGGSSIRVTPTTVRVVCSNTLHMVIPRTEESGYEKAAICLRHSGDLKSKLEEAKMALKHYGRRLKENREMMERLHEQKITRDQARRFFAHEYASEYVAPQQDELEKLDIELDNLNQTITSVKASQLSGEARKTRLREQRMKRAGDAFLKRWDQEQKDLGMDGSMWLAVNSFTGYVQHDRWGSTSDLSEADRKEKVLTHVEANKFGENSNRSVRVFSDALSM